MTTTPPPPDAIRARTPPTPLHGPAYDNYEPYSPRRSKRSTAHSNPYSSFNGERSPKAHLHAAATTPPATIKKTARFAWQPTQLSSPPSSPASPVRVHKTPRKQLKHSQRRGAHSSSDSEGGPSNSLAPPAVTMLPTPSKTPQHKRAQRHALNSTARILSFQPNDPNDVMPSPRRMRKHHSRPMHSMAGFELYEDEAQSKASDGIEIYRDANARVPEMDESEDNPFIGRKRTQGRPQRRSRKTAAEAEREAKIDEAVRRDEGVVYVFRGKRIFRRFEDPRSDDASAAGTEISGTPEQRRLKHQAGPAAQRPLTRSAIKPRLLFPSQDQDQQEEDEIVDEEAVTDIDMPDHQHSPAKSTAKHVDPLMSPPPTIQRATRSKKMTPMPEEEPEPMSGTADDTFAEVNGGGKGRSPFDTWQRTKNGRKRAGELAVAEGSGKRTRSAVLDS